MKFGLSLFPTHFSAGPVEIAIEAERLGFESFFVSEHSHIPVDTKFPLADEVPMMYRSMYDPFVAMAAMAAVTKTIKVGTAIIIVPQHNPINCAKSIASIDHMSGGRVLFGVGAGWNPLEMRHHGVDFSNRFKFMRESLAAMKELWTKDEAEYHGELIDISPSWLWPKPVQKPHPPIIVAGSGPNILKRCVELGQGWMPIFTPDWHDSLEGKMVNYNKLPEYCVKLRELEEEAGKPHTSITAMGLPPTPEYLDVMEKNGVERLVLNLPSDSPEAGFEALQAHADAVNAYM